MTPTGESFPLTRLSVLAAARSQDAAERARALDTVFAAYWKPVYKYIRLKFSQSPQDAQDLTQGFFVELLERKLLSRFDPTKSRLRSYLRLCVDSFVLNEMKAASRKKRGGEIAHVALDFSAAEDELCAQRIDPASIPSPESFEDFFEKEWIRSLFSSAVEELRGLCDVRKKRRLFRFLNSTISAKKMFPTPNLARSSRCPSPKSTTNSPGHVASSAASHWSGCAPFATARKSLPTKQKAFLACPRNDIFE